MTDFLIVGRGLAATVLMHRFRREGIGFHAIGRQELSQSSRVAAGIWNPVVFKRMTQSWMAATLVESLLEFYRECETRLSTELLTLCTIVKPFTEQQEKRLWQTRSEGALKEFLDPVIYGTLPPNLQGCTIANGYGRVLQSGYLHVPRFIDASTRYFSESITNDYFDHAQLQLGAADVNYKGLRARNVVFCEGHLVRANPFFSWLPLQAAKGEVLTVSAPGLQLLGTIFNRNGFLLPLGGQQFKIGATYNWNDSTDLPTAAGLAELQAKLGQMTSASYQLLQHQAGVRPATVDRRPLLGQHPQHHHLFVFNGLGTKGVMLAPFFSKNFVHFFLQKQPLNTEVNIQRFYDRYVPQR